MSRPKKRETAEHMTQIVTTDQELVTLFNAARHDGYGEGRHDGFMDGFEQAKAAIQKVDTEIWLPMIGPVYKLEEVINQIGLAAARLSGEELRTSLEGFGLEERLHTLSDQWFLNSRIFDVDITDVTKYPWIDSIPAYLEAIRGLMLRVPDVTKAATKLRYIVECWGEADTVKMVNDLKEQLSRGGRPRTGVSEHRQMLAARMEQKHQAHSGALTDLECVQEIIVDLNNALKMCGELSQPETQLKDFLDNAASKGETYLVSVVRTARRDTAKKPRDLNPF
jgi:hypothetical protein